MFVRQKLVGSVLDRGTQSFKGLAGTVFAEGNLSEAQWETACQAGRLVRGHLWVWSPGAPG